MRGSGGGDMKYRAFISYSQKDKSWARRIHRAIERYKVPADLLIDTVDQGRRVGKVFLDTEEKKAATSIDELLKAAIRGSECLIVVCSPNAVASRFVNEEISYFKSHNPGGKILPVIIGGEPNARDAGDEDNEAFPLALVRRVDADGTITEDREEPFAADARPGKDGFARVKAQLIAGILNIDFDALWKREERATRRRALVFQGLAATMTLVAGIAVFGLWAALSNFAERTQRESFRLAELSIEATTEGDATRGLLLALEASYLQPGSLEQADPLALQAAAYAARQINPYTSLGAIDLPWDASDRKISISGDDQIVGILHDRASIFDLGDCAARCREIQLDLSVLDQIVAIGTADRIRVSSDGKYAAVGGTRGEYARWTVVYSIEECLGLNSCENLSPTLLGLGVFIGVSNEKLLFASVDSRGVISDFEGFRLVSIDMNRPETFMSCRAANDLDFDEEDGREARRIFPLTDCGDVLPWRGTLPETGASPDNLLRQSRVIPRQYDPSNWILDKDGDTLAVQVYQAQDNAQRLSPVSPYRLWDLPRDQLSIEYHLLDLQSCFEQPTCFDFFDEGRTSPLILTNNQERHWFFSDGLVFYGHYDPFAEEKIFQGRWTNTSLCIPQSCPIYEVNLDLSQIGSAFLPFIRAAQYQNHILVDAGEQSLIFDLRMCESIDVCGPAYAISGDDFIALGSLAKFSGLNDYVYPSMGVCEQMLAIPICPPALLSTEALRALSYAGGSGDLIVWETEYDEVAVSRVPDLAGNGQFRSLIQFWQSGAANVSAKEVPGGILFEVGATRSRLNLSTAGRYGNDVDGARSFPGAAVLDRPKTWVFVPLTSCVSGSGCDAFYLSAERELESGGVAFDPTSRRLALPTKEGLVVVWSLNSCEPSNCQPTTYIAPSSYPLRSIQMSRLAFAEGGQELIVVDARFRSEQNSSYLPPVFTGRRLELGGIEFGSAIRADAISRESFSFSWPCAFARLSEEAVCQASSQSIEATLDTIAPLNSGDFHIAADGRGIQIRIASHWGGPNYAEISSTSDGCEADCELGINLDLALNLSDQAGEVILSQSGRSIFEPRRGHLRRYDLSDCRSGECIPDIFNYSLPAGYRSLFSYDGLNSTWASDDVLIGQDPGDASRIFLIDISSCQNSLCSPVFVEAGTILHVDFDANLIIARKSLRGARSLNYEILQIDECLGGSCTGRPNFGSIALAQAHSRINRTLTRIKASRSPLDMPRMSSQEFSWIPVLSNDELFSLQFLEDVFAGGDGDNFRVVRLVQSDHGAVVGDPTVGSRFCGALPPGRHNLTPRERSRASLPDEILDGPCDRPGTFFGKDQLEALGDWISARSQALSEETAR